MIIFLLLVELQIQPTLNDTLIPPHARELSEEPGSSAKQLSNNLGAEGP